MSTLSDPKFFDRDLSWLSFNGRVLEEAQRQTVPLMERLTFLSIYSSNLDEFYRVRMPALLALHKVSTEEEAIPYALPQINAIIQQQQEKFGFLLSKEIIPQLAAQQIILLFNQPIPAVIKQETENYFFERVAGYIQLIDLESTSEFFPENNKLYLAATVQTVSKEEKHYILNVPTDQLPRFSSFSANGVQYILFLEDIIKLNLPQLFSGLVCINCHSFKITRDAELDLKDELEGNLAKKIEREIAHRDLGLASRFLFEKEMPAPLISTIQKYLQLKAATLVKGGVYHNLKDLSALPVSGSVFYYQPWKKKQYHLQPEGIRLFDYLKQNDILLHPPYHSYDTVLRFFNEAAIDVHVTKIYVTLYRIANDSRIASALISAAKNGKKVTVFVELKARFDEANNIKWAKRMKEAGIRVLFSIPQLKVHAKIALVKRKVNGNQEFFGLLSTGNFNESTARFYTDHLLLTSHQEMLQETARLFLFLKKRRKPDSSDKLVFRHLLVAQFNLQTQFMALIDREIINASQGREATVTIKLNNLEDKVLITKLYEASGAGVRVMLIVRSICCLIPGVKGLSENITVRRIVDRYLEHGRIFVFHNNGQHELFLGSADWMNRNIYHRIEVCFPVYNESLKNEIISMLALQLQDTVQAVTLDQEMNNVPIATSSMEKVQSQSAISQLISR